MCTVSGETLVMFVIKSSRYLQACSRWVVLMMICTNYSKTTIIVVNNLPMPPYACVRIHYFVYTSVSPIWGFLMRFCKQLLSVLVSSRLVDFRNMSSISVELKSQHLRQDIRDDKVRFMPIFYCPPGLKCQVR